MRFSCLPFALAGPFATTSSKYLRTVISLKRGPSLSPPRELSIRKGMLTPASVAK